MALIDINTIDKKKLAEAIKVLDKLQGLGVQESTKMLAPEPSKKERERQDRLEYRKYLIGIN